MTLFNFKHSLFDIYHLNYAEKMLKFVKIVNKLHLKRDKCQKKRFNKYMMNHR